MKQVIISFLLVMILVACNESADNKPTNTTERFPGFIQVGSNGASSRLYIDLGSVKQSDNLVQLKLVKALDIGYVIQDAITDCNGSFKALEGVQYRDDGTSDKKYPGDVQPMPFSGKPDIAALVKQVCDKAGMASQTAAITDAPKTDKSNNTEESSLPEASPNKLQTRAGCWK